LSSHPSQLVAGLCTCTERAQQTLGNPDRSTGWFSSH